MEHTYAVKDGDLVVTVSSSKEELSKIEGKAIRSLAQGVTVRGFRKGKAPLELALPLIDKEELNDVFTRKLIDAAFKSYVEDIALLEQIDKSVPVGVVPSVQIPAPKDGSKVIFSYPVKPQVEKLGAYTKIKTGVKKAEVTDKEIQAELAKMAKDLSDLVPVSEPIANGNYANCDIKGSINGIENPTLSEKALDVVVGAKKFIPGFENKLLGHKAGEDLKIEAVLPDNYPADVAGKTAVFNVKINSVKKEEVPAIDDSLATTQDIYPDVKNLAELKEKVKAALVTKNESSFKDQKFGAVITKAVSDSKFVIDEAKLKPLLVENQRKEDEKTLSQQGLDLNTYLRLIKMTKEQYETNVYSNLIARLKVEAVEDAIFKDAKLKEPTPEELAQVAKKGGIPDLDSFKKDLAKQYLAHNKKASQPEADEFVKEQLDPVYKQAYLDKVVSFVLANSD